MTTLMTLVPLAGIGTSIKDFATDAITSAGYAGLAGIMAIEVIFPPIPSEIVLPLAGFEVSSGDLNFFLALIAATIGATFGSLVLYWIARYGGRPAVMRFSKVLRVTEKDMDKADAWFDQRGTWIVFGGRMIPGMRSLVSVPAGLSEMPLGRFIAATASGSALWSAALIGIGMGLESQYEDVEQYIGPASRVVLVLFIVAAIAGFVWLRRRGARKAAGETAS